MKKVVVIGGGNGASLTLAALKPLHTQFDITGVITMCDSGGSTGKLRAEFNCLPPGDILRNTLALSLYDFDMLKEIFYKKRFSGVGKLSEHNLGNIFLTLASQYSGDFLSAVTALGQALQIVGKVVPANLTPGELVVELDTGVVVRGEAAIDCPQYDRIRTINVAWLEPKVMANPDAITAIKEADYIILGGGDIYSSMIAALLPIGIQDAIVNSDAPLVYISNRYYHPEGETVPHRLSQIIPLLEKYTGRPIDTVIVDPTPVTPAEQLQAREKKWGIKEFDPEHIHTQIVTGDFDAKTVGIDVSKLSGLLKNFLV
jgi:uncharacterized cofD-like protein